MSNTMSNQSILQKVVHVETQDELLNCITKSFPSKSIDQTVLLSEKVNGFYATINAGTLLRALRDRNSTTALCHNPSITFTGRNKLSHTIHPSQLSNLNELCVLLDVVINYHNNLALSIREDANDLIVIGELVETGAKQDFNRNSSALRKHTISGDISFCVYCITPSKAATAAGVHNNLLTPLIVQGEISRFNKLTGVNWLRCALPLLPTIDLEHEIKSANYEGLVYYSPNHQFTNNKRTNDVVALKFPLLLEGTIIGCSYNNTVRGKIITRVNVQLLSGQRVVLGSGIDDNLRTLLESITYKPEQIVKVTVKAERRSDVGALIKPVISHYYQTTKSVENQMENGESSGESTDETKH